MFETLKEFLKKKGVFRDFLMRKENICIYRKLVKRRKGGFVIRVNINDLISATYDVHIFNFQFLSNFLRAKIFELKEETVQI